MERLAILLICVLASLSHGNAGEVPLDARLTGRDGKIGALSDVLLAARGSPLLGEAALPASFVYGGQSSETLLKQWARTNKPPVATQSRRIYEMRWTEPGGGLAATWHAEVFADRPAIEFHWIFENLGQQPSKPLTDVHALDVQVGRATRTRLVHGNGGLSDATAFLVSESPLRQPLQLSAVGGRSSNKDLPFFLLHDEASQSGVFMGVGWSGQWQANFHPDAASGMLRITAGMTGVNLALPAGARISSPTILLGSYRGDSQDGGNALRRILFDHYVATLDGKKPLPPVSWNHWFTYENNISESMLMRQMDAAAGLGVEYFCIDAGWFEGGFPAGVGNWTIDGGKFPGGLAPIAAYAAKKDMKLGLWFEPGRADPATRLAREHPEWMSADHVRLEIPEARQWIFQMMSGFIDQGQIRWIRYDYNFDPLAQWDRCDTPETRGLTQIRYLQGEYELFDLLRRKYPGLLIESCASGGRRIDLETIRRAHTFWKSDETANLRLARSQETGANRLLPGGLLNTNLPASSPADSFDLHSLFAGPLGFAIDWTRLDAAARQRIRRGIAAYKSVRHLLNKDYYPLFPQTLDPGQWVGWEFCDPAAGEGFIVVLRPAQSACASASVRLRGIDENATYRLSRLDGSHLQNVSGRELAAGWRLSLDAHQSEALHFQK
jgi:alpha-galactosidase